MADRNVELEAHVHGKHWAAIYEGYFSDRNISADYVAAVMRAARAGKPASIVDLGGGTGFILQELVAAGIAEETRLINLDESGPQLAACAHPRINTREGSIQSLRREDIAKDGESIMLICRSVLHYGGIGLQRPWLGHLRALLKPGEWFVHQSGCSGDVEAALALDVLFEMAGVEKWVPHRDALVQLLQNARFEITEDFPVPMLAMPSSEFAGRYNVRPENMARIQTDLARTCRDRPDLYRETPGGFIFSFPYRVFMCRAKGSEA